MLNEKMDELLLVKGWKKGANWSFPRGKINKDEPDLECAVREVYEETGYDIKAAGLVGNEEEMKYIEMNLREQHMRLYVFRGVPMDTFFEPRTRKEISKIQWWRLSDLPTLRKKKQPQDNQAGELANNANKFYMVAPFLPQLKKWISGQRKLDQTRHANSSAAVPDTQETEPMTAEEPDKENGTTLLSSNGDMARLLDSLRQSAQPAIATQSPGPLSGGSAAEEKAAQLKSFLGVPSAPSVAPQILEKTSAPVATTAPSANSLLALLQSKPAEAARPPQTPMEQIIEHPKQPPSPPLPQHQPHRFSAMPTPPSFPTANQLAMGVSRHLRQAQASQIHSIQPPRQPAQPVHRASLQHNKSPQRPSLDQQPVAPYRRTGDPQFARYAQVSSEQPASVPLASKLPPPKLTAQSSALLDLFKTGPAAKVAANNKNGLAPMNDSKQLSTVVPDSASPQTMKSFHSDVNNAQPQTKQPSRQVTSQANVFLPPQVSPSIPSKKGMESNKPKTEHHDRLLSLFKSPATAKAEPVKVVASGTTLQLPSTPIELSALPLTPGHSREPSAAEKSAQAQLPILPRTGSMKTKNRPQQITAKSHGAPVSATVSGPLNVPQFDMLAKASKDAKHVGQKDGHKQQAHKRSPITILARPAASPKVPAVSMQNPVDSIPTVKSVAPRLQTLVTPTKKLPPTPDLKGQDAPPKPFLPQILRRPALPDDANEPSPIQPLPSPKQKLFMDRRSTQPNDPKKSLLSLFTKPSPIISPPSAAAPMSAIDPSALISPISGLPPQKQADAAFARPATLFGKSSDEKDTPLAPPRVSLSKRSSTNNIVADGVKSENSNVKRTPTMKSTPIDKSFLLGYLEGVAKSGR